MKRIQTLLITSALCGASFGSVACNRSPEEAHSEAVEAQQEAVQNMNENNQEAAKTINEAQQEAAKTAGEANKETAEAVAEANKKIAEAQQEARQDNAQEQAKANEDIREANADVVGAKAELKVWGQKKIDDLNNAIDTAKAKAQAAPAKAQANFDVAMKQVQTKRDELSSQLASIETQGAKEATAFKERLDAEVGRLKTRVEKLESSL